MSVMHLYKVYRNKAWYIVWTEDLTIFTALDPETKKWATGSSIEDALHNLLGASESPAVVLNMDEDEARAETPEPEVELPRRRGRR